MVRFSCALHTRSPRVFTSESHVWFTDAGTSERSLAAFNTSGCRQVAAFAGALQWRRRVAALAERRRAARATGKRLVTVEDVWGGPRQRIFPAALRLEPSRSIAAAAVATSASKEMTKTAEVIWAASPRAWASRPPRHGRFIRAAGDGLGSCAHLVQPQTCARRSTNRSVVAIPSEVNRRLCSGYTRLGPRTQSGRLRWLPEGRVLMGAPTNGAFSVRSHRSSKSSPRSSSGGDALRAGDFHAR